MGNFGTDEFEIIVVDSSNVFGVPDFDQYLKGRFPNRLKIQYYDGWSTYGLFNGKYKLHSFGDSPANLSIDSGKKSYSYYKEGFLNRSNGKPAIEEYDKKGRLYHSSFYTNGELRKGNEPCAVNFNYKHCQENEYTKIMYYDSDNIPGRILSIYKRDGQNESAQIIGENGEIINIKFEEGRIVDPVLAVLFTEK